MGSHDDTDTDHSVTRRRVLATLGSGAVAATGVTAGCVDSVSSGSEETTTTADGTVQFGHSAALTGTYLSVGSEEQLGFELAVRHLNQGGGLVDEGVFDDLSGDGVLGNTVETVTIDSAGTADQARSNLTPYLEEGELAMFCGGVAGDVAMEHRAIAGEYEIPYLAGTTMLSSLTGADCSQYVFREKAPSDAIMRALGPTLKSEFGEEPTFEQVHVDATEGEDFVQSVRTYLNDDDDLNWDDLGTIPVRKGSTDASDLIAEFNDLELDAVFCHLYGLDAENFVSQAAADLNEETTLIFPWINQSMTETLEDDVAGIIGTASWDAGIDTNVSETFSETYTSEAATITGSPSHVATGPAHDMYCQTLAYAAAAERAGSFDADAVGKEFEGMRYRTALGEQTMQACNHQANKPVPVVRGQSSRTSNGGWFAVESTQVEVVAGCDQAPASNCSF